MRVIAGIARGRRLQAPTGQAVRPTSDKVKGAIFSILTSRVPLVDTVVLDLFSGSGALGIEALSRGVAHVTFVEQAAPAVQVLQHNLRTCRMTEHSHVLPLPIARALPRLARARQQFDGVLLDPPYAQHCVDRTLQALVTHELVAPEGWVMVEHEADEPVAAQYGPLQLTHTRAYGKTHVALLRASPAA